MLLPPTTILFPYTTLFRSPAQARDIAGILVGRRVLPAAGHGLRRAVGEHRAHAGFLQPLDGDRKSTRLNSSHGYISYAVFCLKKKIKETRISALIVELACH